VLRTGHLAATRRPATAAGPDPSVAIAGTMAGRGHQWPDESGSHRDHAARAEVMATTWRAVHAMGYPAERASWQGLATSLERGVPAR